MKKILALVLALCMIFALCACGKTAPAEETAAVEETAEAEVAEEAVAEEAAEETAAAALKLGMGVSVSTDSTADANAQVDATVAAVVTDENGVITACAIDCAQNKMDVTALDTAKEFKSKMELGDDYNMVAYGGSTYEWYQQADAFAAYCVGKTADEISGMETVKNEEGYSVTTDEALYATCSISIDAFINAVVKACADEWAVEFTADSYKLGVACNSTAAESTEATDEEAGSCNMYTEFGAAVVDAEGKILACVNDAIQPKIAYTKDGVVGDVTFNGTKRELGENYNMVTYGNAIAEWDAQSAAFSAYCTGMTADEVLAIETVVNEEGNNVATDETLLASCTMSISGMGAVMAKAANNAK